MVAKIIWGGGGGGFKGVGTAAVFGGMAGWIWRRYKNKEGEGKEYGVYMDCWKTFYGAYLIMPLTG